MEPISAPSARPMKIGMIWGNCSAARLVAEQARHHLEVGGLADAHQVVAEVQVGVAVGHQFDAGADDAA